MLCNAMKIFILLHGFGNVGNFAFLRACLGVSRRVASGVDVPMIDPRVVLNICWMLLYNTSIFRVRCI
jgi:hypothetical protein